MKPTEAQESIMIAAEQFAKSELEQDPTGHDWWHVHRVDQMARRLAESEGADLFICAVAALLHDVADEGANPPMRTIEGKVVQDADRLDAIGAIAIARTFLYAGWIGHPIYDPQIAPRDYMSPKAYRQEKSTAINHFPEKLLKLKGLINTASAKPIAEERHRFMEQYLEQFHLEWDGK